MKRQNSFLFFVSCLIVFYLILPENYSFGQSVIDSNLTKPEIGKPLPEFYLSNVAYFNKTQLTQHDLKGKWLFLDFWFQGCSSCIQSFPKVNEIYKEFKNELTWLMIGLNDRRAGKNVREFYEKIQAKRKLEMPVAYDSTLARKWEVHAMPYIIVADPNGIVRYITDGRNITANRIRKLLNGDSVNFYESTLEYKSDDILTNGTGSSLVYGSAISKWNGERNTWVEIDRWATWPEEELRKGYKLSMAPLIALYYYAYVGRFAWDVDNDSLYGKFYTKPIIEVKDSAMFSYSFGTDESGRISGMYNYHLILPVSEVTAEKVTKLMREDLKRTFRYTATIELRDMPVWKLVAKQGAVEKLKTKGDPQYASPGTHAAGYTIINIPPKYLIATISFYLKNELPFVDETGLSENFDLTLNADMTNFDDVVKAINKKGLDLIKGTKKMRILVIRDENQSN